MTQDAPENSAREAGQARPGPVAWVLLLPIHAYRWVIGPLLPPSCRFYPSCSAYAVEALTVHGAFRGSWLTLRRLGKCGPWHPGGLDPVPPAGRPARQGDTGRGSRPNRSVPTDERPHPTHGEE